MHPLDNPAWNALTHLQRSVSFGNDLARRYEPAISPIAAVADSANPACWTALADVAGAGSLVGVFAIAKHAPPDGWSVDWRYSFAQMTCTKAAFKVPTHFISHSSMRALTLADGPAMVALATLAQPGPMEMRTVTLGRYLGIFDENDMLIAMAGERMRLDGATEVSGVCTHPDHRGKRYAQILSAAIAENILERGDTAFLHVRDGNAGAASVYEKLGFGVRAVFDIAAVKKC
ncbi:FR47 domain-containing protein [Caballeronia sordidicola]|uniref:FR47 domain-containing protein n=2 Tax=Caballeronia TaxID=1827195 RepID=A0A158EMS4_CABSO|nr:GNAT family N-acetyltransferase [Caballeronia sordidicola]SAL08878.1 FR47 domain-containing protein [Caballeronia sordidicola]